jgi:hypothetical protein
MDLDRGALAKIDRGILSGLGHHEHSQMVRVPVSEAVWSTWRRYCRALGVAMGRGVAGLIAHELGTVEDSTTGGGAAFAGELQRELVARAEDLDVRERRLDEREQLLRASERRLRARATPLASAHAKVGRNEPCPCGSGFKYKHCHGLAGRRSSLPVPGRREVS